MKKKIFALLASAMCLVLGLSATACGGGGGKVKEGTITLYMTRAAGMQDGIDAEDAKVKKAIEDKFFADTGKKVSLDVSIFSDTDIAQTTRLKWQQIDGVSGYIGYDGIVLERAQTKNYSADVKETIQSRDKLMNAIQGPDKSHLAERTGYVNVNGTYEMRMIPSVENTQGYGILVRKDFMRTLYQGGKITTNPDEYDAKNATYKNMTFAEFSSMLSAMKDNIRTIQRPMEGSFWDMNRIFGSCFGIDMYSMMKSFQDKYAPAQFNEKSGAFMDQIWQWAKDGIVNEELAPDTTIVNSNFFSGKSGVYITYPQVANLLSVARQLKAVDPAAEYMILGPLADSEGKVCGFQSMQQAFNGIAIQKQSPNTELILDYLDWMYSSKENYELCKYGIKGEHWVDGESITVDGVTYDTWSYPQDKQEQYSVTSPYSGKYCLLTNVNVSDRIRGDYDPYTEAVWYAKATHSFQTFESGAEEGIWVPTVPQGTMNTHANWIDNEYADKIRADCVTGTGQRPSERLADYRSRYTDSTSSYYSQDYLDYVDKAIRDGLSYFANLWK